MALTATMAYILMIFFILGIIVDIKTTPVQKQELNISSVPSEESTTDVYSLTTTDFTGAEKNSHLNMSNFEEVTHNPPGVGGLNTPSLITLSVETHVSNTSDVPLDEKSTFVDISTMMLTTTDSINIENGSHNMSNNEEVTHKSPGVDYSTLFPSWFTLSVETYAPNNASDPPLDENSTDFPLTMLTITDTIDIENGSHSMSNSEKVTHKPPAGVDYSTLFPSWFTLSVETYVSNNSSDPPSEENSTAVDSTSTTISILDSVQGSKNVPLVESRAAGETHNLSALDDSSFSYLYTLNVKKHIHNSSGGSFTENSTYINPSEIISTTTDSTDDAEYAPFNMSNYKDVCGRQLIPMSRIVGGDDVSFGEWPWQILLRNKKKNKQKCGAVLFNENWAITSAHCVKNVSIKDIHLILGKYDFTVKDEPYGYLIRKLQTVIIHPKYNIYALEYDLALLRFDKPVKFQPNILPVCIPESDSNYAGYSAHISGWGALYYDGVSPVALQGATVSVINNSVCEHMFRAIGYIKKIPDTFICAGSTDGGYDACKGDSGGPMVVQRPDKRWEVVGIIAWGIRCGEANSPGVYMRITKFKDWINKIIL